MTKTQALVHVPHAAVKSSFQSLAGNNETTDVEHVAHAPDLADFPKDVSKLWTHVPHAIMIECSIKRPADKAEATSLMHVAYMPKLAGCCRTTSKL